MSDELPLPVRRVLDEGVDEASIRRVWSGIEAKRHGSSRSPWLAAAALVAAAAMALAVPSLFPGEAPSGPLRLSNGDRTPSRWSSTQVEFEDGSYLELDGELEVLENAAEDLNVLLRRGSLDVHVQPGGPRRWTVDSGLLSVEVLGTRFRIERSERAARVEVMRGVVLVRSDYLEHGVRRLSSGEHVQVERPPAVQAPPPAEERSPAPPSVSPPTEPVERGPGWRALASRGDYDAAFDALGVRGHAQRSRRASDSETLLELADVARLSGHPAQAAIPLQRVLDEHADTPGAPLAAFTLGRLRLAAGNAAGAAVAFRQARDLGLPPNLEEDAYLREYDAWTRAGDALQAAAVRESYAGRYPQGRHLANMR